MAFDHEHMWGLIIGADAATHAALLKLVETQARHT
jgi:hypothetical protein